MNVGVTLQLWNWSGVFFWWAREPYTCVWPLSFLLLSSPDSWLSAVCTFALFASLQKVTLHHALYFVRCDVSHLDDCNAFDATRWGHDKTTYIDFQLVKDGNGRTLSELIGSNLSGSRLDRNEREYDQKKALLPNVLVSVSTTCSVQRAGNPRWLQSHCSKHHQGDICVDTA